MSVILDVLRKLDREKSSRRSATAKIALEILKPDLPRSENRIPLFFTAIGLTAVATAAITYALVGFGVLSKSPSPELINPSTTSQEIAQAPLDSGSQPKSSLPPPKSPPVLSQQVTPAPIPQESGRDTRDEISRVPPKIRTPADNKTPATFPDEKKASKNVILKKASVAPKITDEFVKKTPTPPQQVPDTSAITPPSLKISAIVWYDEPFKRFAMINDRISHEGSVIEGVKVEEIYPNRVRFSHEGRFFVISVK
jgi:general secretion pathway protein B